MSIQQSYLSKKIDGQKIYNADMVTAISDKALNSQMRLYLSTCNWDTRVYFLDTMDEETGNSILFMLQNGTDETKIPEVFSLSETVAELHNQNSSIFNELEKLYLFDLPSGTSIEDPALSKALDYSFSFALHLADGIPDEVMQYLVFNKDKIDIDEALNIITLDSTKKAVLFRQFFKEFEVIQVNISLKGKKVVGKLSKVAQDCSGENPIEKMWSTRASIGIDFRPTSHKDIESDEIRDKIEKMAVVSDPDTAFDISQLLLDLSTLQTVSPVVIEGISPEIKGTVSGFVQEYFDRLEKAGQTIFGYVILPKPSEQLQYLFTPVMRNFDVSDRALYYLLNLKDDHNYEIPSIGKYKDFEWAPLLDGKITADGVMAINATKFIPLIRSKVEKLLPNLIMTKHPYVDAGVYKYKIKWDEPAVPTDQHFNVPENAPWTCNWSYAKDYNQDYERLWTPPVLIPVASGKICSKYSINCDGKPGSCQIDGVTYPSYDFKFQIKGWMNYDFDKQSNSGDYYDHTILFQVAIKVNPNGHIEFLQNVIDTDNYPKGIEVHGWGDFCSFGTLQGTVDEMCKSLSDVISVLTVDVVKTFLKGYNTSTTWFMPGARAFTYKNEGISNYGDLFTHVNYVQETC